MRNEGGQAVRPTDGTFVLAFINIFRDSSKLGNNCVVVKYQVYRISLYRGQDRKDLFFAKTLECVGWPGQRRAVVQYYHTLVGT